MDINLPTCGQLERNLSQSIQKLYLSELEHSPSKVTCQLFGNQLAIVVEDSLTAVEQALAEIKSDGSIEELNSAVGEVIKSKMKLLTEEILGVEVEDILFDTAVKTKRTGAIITLRQLPQVRNPESIPKSKSGRRNKSDDRARG